MRCAGGWPSDLPSQMPTDARELLQTGIAHHQAGRFDEAATAYREVLRRFPQHADALHMLGVLAHHRGAHEAAVDLIGQALRIIPQHAACHSNLGNALRALGRGAEALRSYRRALELSPDFADAHLNLGNLLQEQGRSADAIAHYRQAVALRPAFAEAHYNLGNALRASGAAQEAIASYRRALDRRPDYAEALNNLGNTLQSLGRLDEALECYVQAIGANPRYAEAWNNVGFVHAAQFRHDAAIAAIGRALEIRPDYPEALQNMGTQYEATGRLDEALDCYRRAVALKPGFAMAHNNIGNALLGLGDLDGSQAAYTSALSLDPELAEAHGNLGNLMQSRGQLDEAIRCVDRALELNPGAADLLWNKAFALLLKGDFEAGWALAEARWQFASPGRVQRRFHAPPWLGTTPVTGRSILLHHEQGLGDTLQMLRYVPLLAAQGARVIVQVPAALAGVAATVPGVDAVVVEGGESPVFDLHCPFMSLPLACATTLATVPAAVPYLFAPASVRAAWSERLAPLRRPRIGLAWSGSVTHRNDRHRSLPLATLLRWLPDTLEYVSLQNEYRPADAPLLQPGGRVRDFADALTDFAATAGLIGELDLVVTVDTAVAHLAGGMGKPTWLLLPFAPDYRWLLGREDSPWYPSMRLLRQPRFGDWGAVATTLREALLARFPAG